jgi:outer membrane protein W
MNKFLVATAVLLASQTSYAGNWYVGLGLGAAHADDASENIAAGNSTLPQFGIGNITSSDDNSGALSLLGGYHFNPHIAAELDYYYLGSYDMHGFTGPGRTPPSGRERNEADAFSIAAVLTAPLNDSFSLYGKLGPTLTDNEEWTCTSDVWWCDHASDTKFGTMAGAGISFTFPRLIGAFRLEADRFSNVGDKNTEFTAGRFTTLQFQYVYTFSN